MILLGTENYMMFYHMKKNRDYYIITRDQGFRAILNMAKNLGMSVKIKTYVGEKDVEEQEILEDKVIKLNNSVNKTNIIEDDYMNQYKKNKKLVENLIKKEIIMEQKENKKFNIQECLNEEIKNGFYRYRDLTKNVRE